MKFKELNLSNILLDNIEKEGYVETTPIQSLAIPHILKGKDVMGIAQTGTGKTAAFSLPILQKLIEENKQDKKIKVLILSPTRELAIQIRDNIRNYSEGTNFKCSVILGGVNQNSQITVLKKGVDILVATPGRLLDLTKQKYTDLSNVEMLVLDEADTMLDMGFIKDIKEIVSKTPKNRQTMLFSATMPKEIKLLSKEFLNDPINVSATTESTPAPKIKQLLYFVDKKNKTNLLLDILSQKEVKTSLIFTRTKYGANKLAEELREYNIKVSVIHGNKSQNDRVRSLENFKSGKTNTMIATDIAARGIDINELSQVINYDMPEQAELYVHRIGRTGRAGNEGTSISLCTNDEKSKLLEIERLIKQQLNLIEEHKYPMIEQPTMPKKINKDGSAKTKYSRNNKTTRMNNNFDRNNKKDYKKNFSQGKSKKYSDTNKKDYDSNSKMYDRNDTSNKITRYDRNDASKKTTRYDRNDTLKKTTRYDRNDTSNKTTRYDRNDASKKTTRYDRNDASKKTTRYDRKNSTTTNSRRNRISSKKTSK